MNPDALGAEIDSLPGLSRQLLPLLTKAAPGLLAEMPVQALERVFLVGCGDSHHASVAASLAFEQLAGLPCEAMTAMQFARYKAGFLSDNIAGSQLVIATSVSGTVSRTVEALALARVAGATTVAVTGTRPSPLSDVAAQTLEVPLPTIIALPAGQVVPGCRSYLASLLALFSLALFLGEARSHIDIAEAATLRSELHVVSRDLERTVAINRETAKEIIYSWNSASQWVFCGSGPNRGTALFCAAKFIEAAGDHASGQDTEEWAHLDYFTGPSDTPTVFISAGNWDADRVSEVLIAAKTIGRRVAVVGPLQSALAGESGITPLPYAGRMRECLSPLLACVPGLLMAAERSMLTGEPYFRAFGGGRSIKGGGGISRIRTSHQIEILRR